MGTITKALELLNFYSRQTSEIGLGEFVRLTGRDKATVHRHLVELVENGFLEQNQTTRAYRLGPALLRLSGVREATFPVRRVLRPIVEEVARDVGELTHVSLLQGDVLSPALHFDPMIHGTQVAFDESEILPLHATASGLVTLAFGDPDRVRRILAGKLFRYTHTTITSPEALRDILDDVRETGIASLDRSFDDEVCSHAAPIFDADASVVGGVSIAMPANRDSAEARSRIKATLVHAMQRMTHSLGGTIPSEHAHKWKAQS